MSRLSRIYPSAWLTPRLTAIIVWALRIVVGATFVMSGFTKCIDIWGFSYKIGEYMTVWGLTVPNTVSVLTALSLSVAEFVFGALLILGCYKRSSAWLLLAMMAGMFPLSLYIFIANPVADCGCFGDFWKISNGATFLKNIFLTVALLFLSVYNRKVAGLYRPYVQWLVATTCSIYVAVVALWGYNVQPLIDFRSFPLGSQLIVFEDDDKGSELEYQFIYEKDGIEKAFSATDIPDSTWTFVDRRIIWGEEGDTKTELSIYDRGDDVTEEVVVAEGIQLIVVVPDYRRAGIANTYALNELYHLMDSLGGSMMEVAAIPDEEIDRWSDLSMAEYPIFQADATVLKELSRGVMSAVFLRDGKILWKRTVPSIDIESIVSVPDKEEAIGNLAIDSGRLLSNWTIMLLITLILIDACQLLLPNSRPTQSIKADKKIAENKKK